jgi:broad specificity phosphatase PhoE
MSSIIYFVRHAQGEGNYNRTFMGRTDCDITDDGKRQSELVAKRLKDIDFNVLIASSMKRTVHTAKYIADEKGLNIIENDQLVEINGGDWEGHPFSNLPSLWPTHHETWEYYPHKHQMPNGESIKQLYERVVSAVDQIIKQYPGQNICIVTHGTVLRALFTYFKGLELKDMTKVNWVDNTSVSAVEYSDGEYKVLFEGDTEHLGDEFCTFKDQEWFKEYTARVVNNEN